MATFIKNKVTLKEETRNVDLFDYAAYAKHFTRRLKAKENNPSIIGLFGPHGIGKSVLLGLVEANLGDDVRWFNFDAWKYHDRSSLWEGFILDYAKWKNKKIFKEMEQRLNGEYGNKKSGLAKVLSIPIGFVGNIFVPGAGILASSATDKLSYLFSTSPIRRLHGYEDLLHKLVSDGRKDLYIVLEDIDRSERAGILFLETVSYFFKNAGLKRQIRIIVPMSSSVFDEKETKASVYKAIDYIESFDASNIELTNFINEIFTEEITGDELLSSLVRNWLEHILNTGQINARILKMILRNSDARYDNLIDKGFKAKALFCIIVESLKYISAGSTEFRSKYDEVKAQKTIRDEPLLGILIASGFNKSLEDLGTYLSHYGVRNHHKHISLSHDKDFREEDAQVWLDDPATSGRGPNLSAKLPDIYFFEY